MVEGQTTGLKEYGKANIKEPQTSMEELDELETSPKVDDSGIGKKNHNKKDEENESTEYSSETEDLWLAETQCNNHPSDSCSSTSGA